MTIEECQRCNPSALLFCSHRVNLPSGKCSLNAESNLFVCWFCYYSTVSADSPYFPCRIIIVINSSTYHRLLFTFLPFLRNIVIVSNDQRWLLVNFLSRLLLINIGHSVHLVCLQLFYMTGYNIYSFPFS